MRASNCAHKYRAECMVWSQPVTTRTVFDRAPAGAEALFGIEKLKVPRSSIPAATHVDGSAHIQPFRRNDNPLYHHIIAALHELTGYPIIFNTRFNVQRTDGMYARSCTPLLCEDRDG